MGQTGAELKSDRPTTKHVSTNCQFSRKSDASLPKGLVGARCIAEISIAGEKCHCLLDTGSQVTTVPKSFYEQYLTGYPIHSINDILEVEGANGLSVPYEGYIEVDITFPEEFLGVSAQVPTIALVVPNVKPHNQSMVLVGTNTLDVLYDQSLKSNSPTYRPSSFSYRVVLSTLETRQRQNTSGVLGYVRLKGKLPEIMAA